jgi:phosphatidylserine decarboxylase
MFDSRPIFPFRLAQGVTKELTTVGILLALAVVASIIWPGPLIFLLAGLLVILSAFLLYFFRDPHRTPPPGEGLILAPADGEVVEVRHVHESRFLQGEALRISIFMSLFNVHVNRAPVEADVTWVEHVPGQFLQAFRPEASDVNEHNLIGMETHHGRVLVRQIAGILARRIVCWVHPGQSLPAGGRLGLIKLGSRVDLYLPPGA